MNSTATRNGHTSSLDEFVAAASDLHRRGLVPLPLRDGKNPNFTGWPDYEFSESTFRQKLYKAAEVGVGALMGARGGIVDFEHDTPAQRDKAANLLGGVPPVGPQFESTQGEHWLFKWDDRLTACGKAVVEFPCSDGTKLKVRIGTGPNPGAQSAFPPSRNKHWKSGLSLDDCDPPELPDSTIDELIRQAHAGEERGAIDDGIGGEVDEHVLALMRRIRAKPGENDSSNRLLALACRCVGFDLDDTTSIATIRAYDREQPLAVDWTDADIVRRLRDAERKVERGAERKAIIRNTTDQGNGERFAEQHGADVRHVHVWNKSLVYDGRRWAFDTSGEVMRRAKRTARSIWQEAARAPKKDMRERLGQWASASEKRDRLNAMVALATSEQPIPIAVEQLDSDPYLFNVENGTIDLRTGELREHRREDYLTKLCPIEYPTEPGIDPELWLGFLDRIFASSSPMMRFVQQLIGMSLIGDVQEHVLPIFYGVGANGKSVFLETTCGMLGSDYAMNAPAGLLMATKGDRHPTELADLHGKRFVAAVETADGGRLSEALVKELTGGDSIRARRMREDFWQFRPSHTVVLATNHRPMIRGTDHGIWRRIRLVPFVVTIPDSEQDKQLAVKLRDEWGAILRWAVAGCMDWQRNGLQAPDEVTKATSTYRADMDVLGEFISECCVVDERAEVQASELYKRYKTWAEDRGEHSETQTRFGTRLTERGLQKEKRPGGRIWYRGVKLL